MLYDGSSDKTLDLYCNTHSLGKHENRTFNIEVDTRRYDSFAIVCLRLLLKILANLTRFLERSYWREFVKLSTFSSKAWAWVGDHRKRVR